MAKQVLGTSGVGLDGWTVGEDGTISQDSTTDAGSVALPLHVEEGKSIRLINVLLRRAAAGDRAEVPPTAKMQRRVLDESPAWEDVSGWAESVAWSEAATVLRLFLSRETSSLWVPVAGSSYRLLITGESGSDAQLISLVDVEAV